MTENVHVLVGPQPLKIWLWTIVFSYVQPPVCLLRHVFLCFFLGFAIYAIVKYTLCSRWLEIAYLFVYLWGVSRQNCHEMRWLRTLFDTHIINLNVILYPALAGTRWYLHHQQMTHWRCLSNSCNRDWLNQSAPCISKRFAHTCRTKPTAVDTRRWLSKYRRL